ncbi:MAG: hypothetical protein M3N54_12865, partial [Acidobacteriota bacterium]|nr:hypothetical protein [Acidobacteriota bacterium]
DCADFSRSMESPEYKKDAFTGCLFKGRTLRSDVHALLQDRPAKLRHARDWRDHGLGYVNGYGGKPETLDGLSERPDHSGFYFPPDLKDWQLESARGALTPVYAPDAGKTTLYRKLWLGRILALYRNSRTRIIFLQLPRAPLPLPEGKTPRRFLQSIAGSAGVTVLEAGTFSDLERPALFADGLHLNTAGRQIFSTPWPPNWTCLPGPNSHFAPAPRVRYNGKFLFTSFSERIRCGVDVKPELSNVR